MCNTKSSARSDEQTIVAFRGGAPGPSDASPNELPALSVASLPGEECLKTSAVPETKMKNVRPRSPSSTIFSSRLQEWNLAARDTCDTRASPMRCAVGQTCTRKRSMSWMCLSVRMMGWAVSASRSRSSLIIWSTRP